MNFREESQPSETRNRNRLFCQTFQLCALWAKMLQKSSEKAPQFHNFGVGEGNRTLATLVVKSGEKRPQLSTRNPQTIARSKLGIASALDGRFGIDDRHNGPRDQVPIVADHCAG